MELGAFSVSLAVEDLDRSIAFYSALGFEQLGGDPDGGWVMLKNGPAIIGLFAGMFENNIITFNPGLGQDTQPLTEYADVREIQAAIDAAGLEPVVRVEPDTTGPGHLVIVDPDGNQLMIDQHQ